MANSEKLKDTYSIAGGTMGGGDRSEPRPRAELVEEWRNAPESLVKYSAGIAPDSQGNYYSYLKGTRLMILDQEVMDSCQTLWATTTVDEAFKALPGDKRDVQVLERGFGMGIVATRIMEHLAITGGDYTVIELNEQVAKYAEEDWKNRQISTARNRAMSPIGGTYRDANEIGINIIKGEAFEETAKLVEAGRQFDIIISDTFPLSDDEKSVNDLLDLDQLMKCLAPNGVFAFFGFHTGSSGELNATQSAMIDRHFIGVNRVLVEVAPPPNYKYFNPPTGPVRRLPVFICNKRRTEPLT